MSMKRWGNVLRARTIQIGLNERIVFGSREFWEVQHGL